MSITVFEYVSSGHESMVDNYVHISTYGASLCTMESLCGMVDTHMKKAETNKPVSCIGCKQIYQDIKESKKKIRF